MKKLHLCIASALCASSLAMAQTTLHPATDTTPPRPATATVPASQLTSEFSGWAGSPENADALINGLRTGTAITLTAPAAPGTPSTVMIATTFSPATKPMGYGNIRIALRLAQEQLASQGISNPTPAELQGALIGVPGSPTQGVLQMRAAGMGWGQIANAMGVKLGTVVSGKQPAAPATAYGRHTSTGSTQTHKGVVSASGNASAGRSSGITSGAGVSSHVTTGLGQIHGQGAGAGAGVVNAGGGNAAGLAGGSHAGGNGKGGGKP